MLGRKAWFGPRRFGWGLVPVAPEGWVVVAVAVALALGLGVASKSTRWAVLPVVAVLIIVMFLKGTSPGGPRARDEFESEQGDR